MMRSTTFVILPFVVFAFGALGACGKKESTPPKPAGDSVTTTQDDHDHGEGDEHGHGDTTELGEASSGAFKVRASRDGDITPGSDAAIDVWITPGAGNGAKVAAVRFWIGTEDAKGSIKAKAEIERDNWHTHVEVPDPLPTGSLLWVEIETGAGEVWTASFDLKR